MKPNQHKRSRWVEARTYDSSTASFTFLSQPGNTPPINTDIG
ncbi:hypothetical protein [Moorena sp. SIO1F2]|nr:hypothetical protein [Moorena sp. SIO1F2]